MSETPWTDSHEYPTHSRNANELVVPADQVRELERQLMMLRMEIFHLKEELERNTQEVDSYGEPDSNFRTCSYCHAESGAGLLDKGIPHESNCILYERP